MEDTLAPPRTTSPFTSDHPGPDRFVDRHLGPSPAEVAAMLQVVGYDSLEGLIDATVPAGLRTTEPMALPAAASEGEALAELGELAAQNRVMRSMIGQGYHGTATPAVIRRAVLENPRWYTPYTPYQAEIAQGRLECLLTFQTLVSELTGLPLSNASLLDEATAAAEAMAMCFAVGRQRRAKFAVSAGCHPQTIAVCKTRAGSLGIELAVVSDEALIDAATRAGDGLCGVLVQTPDTRGTVGDYAALAEAVHATGGMVVAAADPLALVLMDPPGSWGADVAVGSTQRFGVPMGMGGPHAAYMATHEKHARKMPGRIVGVSKDAAGRRALRLAIQTREQHIKRDKATSNICTAQALLAVVAQFYAVYHGPDGLRRIAEAVHDRALRLRATLDALGGDTLDGAIFDTVTLRHTDANRLLGLLEARGINARRLSATEVSFACDETTTDADLEAVAACVAEVLGKAAPKLATETDEDAMPRRADAILRQPVFNSYHDEHSFLRHTNRLAGLDLSLADGMIPLGSCTMKLNAAAEMLPIHWPGFADVHPFAPTEQLAGGHAMVEQLNDWLSTITGFAAVSMQPNAGSQGEYAGLITIRAYHAARGEGYRDVCLIPAITADAGLVPCADSGIRHTSRY
ncbi:MAG: glycine dehydrogenase (aminomethyl-transferring), partial [Planctomycetota bacterium]